MRRGGSNHDGAQNAPATEGKLDARVTIRYAAHDCDCFGTGAVGGTTTTMTGDDRNSDDVPPPKEPTATPLFSVEELELSDYKVKHIPEETFDALVKYAEQLAEHSRGDRSDWIKALLGESAVADECGKPNKINVKVYPDGGDGGSDLHYRGATIDVKTVGRHRTDPSLTVDAYEPLRADYYALASRISKNEVRLIGYAPRCFVANADTFKDDFGREYHIVGQRYLFPFPQSLN
jgi:hypothetical protein